ncbi:MAG: hypothetical protein KDA93_02830 [Planctomycetaceae bacterium]|nr:hypothetical protein [Planctomycetaceae bacterium]
MSVRDVEEAKAALTGGADIIDVKEPQRGSLGRADGSKIAEIASTVVDRSAGVAVSAALGEACEWWQTDDCLLPESVRYAKLGLSRLRSNPQWIDRWIETRKAYQRSRTSTIEWIGVIYADEAAAESPQADEIISAAIATGCAGVLVDTWSKTGGHLLNEVPSAILNQWATRLHDAGMFFAVAGRLSIELLPQLRDVAADVIAVRSAACDGQDRQAAVSAQRVREVRAAIDQLSDSPSSTNLVEAALNED